MNDLAEPSMVAADQHGIVFSWPEIWELQEQSEGDDIFISVSSDSTCFWAVRILPGCPPPPQVVDSCVEAFQEEYPDSEVTQIELRLAGMPAFARSVRFSCLDLLNTAVLGSVRTSDFTLLVWWQGTDDEISACRKLLEGMTSSVGISESSNP